MPTFLKLNTIQEHVGSAWRDTLWPSDQLPTRAAISSADVFEYLLPSRHCNSDTRRYAVPSPRVYSPFQEVTDL